MRSPINTSRWDADDWIAFCVFAVPLASLSIAGSIALVIYAAMGRL